MSEQVMQQTRSEQLRYTLHTVEGLSGEEAELYLMAVIDDVSFGCLAAQLATGHYEKPLQDTPSSNEDFARYRRYIRVLSISYRNPWEIVFEVLGSAGVVATAIQTMYFLRSSRRKIEAETAKLRAETKKLEAETRKLDISPEKKEATEHHLNEELASLEQVQERRDLARTLLLRERQDRTRRELLAEIVLKGDQAHRAGKVDDGLMIVTADLTKDVDATIEQLQGNDETFDSIDRLSIARSIADNTRLVASYERLDTLNRAVEVTRGDI